MSTEALSTYWLPRAASENIPEHRFDLTGDHTGVTGVCGCGYVFTGVTNMLDLWGIVTEHCVPIAVDE